MAIIQKAASTAPERLVETKRNTLVSIQTNGRNNNPVMMTGTAERKLRPLSYVAKLMPLAAGSN